jgi:hypothetical protein
LRQNEWAIFSGKNCAQFIVRILAVKMRPILKISAKWLNYAQSGHTERLLPIAKMAFLLVRKNNSQTNLDLAQAFILTDQ